jgi:hypothetical protein
MKKEFLLYLFFCPLFIFVILSCSDSLVKEYPESIQLVLTNNLEQDRFDELIVLGIEKMKEKYPDFNPNAFLVLENGKELSSQANDLDQDGLKDEIVFVSDFSAKEQKTITIRYAESGNRTHSYVKRTQAELSHKVGGEFVNRKYEGGTFKNVEHLRVPPQHTDHSLYIRYEGPGWESDKIGYRFYLDWRNAVDIFGKIIPGMVLQDVGQDGFDSYHEMSSWGMDILKVGESLGIGSIGMWIQGRAERVSKTDSIFCTIVANGVVQSKIRTDYSGWKAGDRKYDLSSELTINAGSRLTRNDLSITGNPFNLCTGIVKHDSAHIIQSTDLPGEWQYLATYGRQSLANDMLGMVIFYRKQDIVEKTDDEQSWVVVLKPENDRLQYYFAAAWEKEPNGITSEADFVSYLNETVIRLDNPVRVEFKESGEE